MVVNTAVWHASTLQADGNTGFDNAFDKVDAILKNEVSATFIGDKPIMVLFMTDGAPSHGQKSTCVSSPNPVRVVGSVMHACIRTGGAPCSMQTFETRM